MPHRWRIAPCVARAPRTPPPCPAQPPPAPFGQACRGLAIRRIVNLDLISLHDAPPFAAPSAPQSSLHITPCSSLPVSISTSFFPSLFFFFLREVLGEAKGVKEVATVGNSGGRPAVSSGGICSVSLQSHLIIPIAACCMEPVNSRLAHLVMERP